jgi:hypothetical protein
MTKDEIRLVAFVLLALVVGAMVKAWRPTVTPAAVAEERKPGWSQPPYVFKNRAAMDAVAEKVSPVSPEPAR